MIAANAEPIRPNQLVAFETVYTKGVGLARDVSGSWVEIEVAPGRTRRVLTRCCTQIRCAEPLRLEVVEPC